jgi:TfoX/Sxy family transcriptional regulator of competence genes
MPYSETLAYRMRELLERKKHLVEKKMFGGLGWLHHGNMSVGIWKDHLILRLGVEGAEVAMERDEVEPFNITGKAMKGWVMIAERALDEDATLKTWVDQSLEFVAGLPPK